MHTLNIYIY